MKVYFDNAATTPLDPEVFDAMQPYFIEHYGNPSSIHAHGRQARAAIEKSRKSIADLLHTSPAEIFFTSGGTESNNMAIHSALATSGVRQVITSRLEHHAVLHPLAHWQQLGKMQVHFVRTDAHGALDMKHLEELLRLHAPAFVSLMHANNEIGNLNDIHHIGECVQTHRGCFHSDTVQSIGQCAYDLSAAAIDYLVGSAHKIHGPKGCGFLYARREANTTALIHGGAQERNRRGGTENVAGIVGLAKAMEIAHRDRAHHQKHIAQLKTRMVARLKEAIPGVTFHGLSGDTNQSLHTILNVALPNASAEDNDLLIFNLDIQGICVSGGSACTSGAVSGSHVIQGLHETRTRAAIRCSFSKYNTADEIDDVVQALAKH